MSIPCEGLNSLPSLKNDDISSNPKSSPNSIDALSVALRNTDTRHHDHVTQQLCCHEHETQFTF